MILPFLWFFLNQSFNTDVGIRENGRNLGKNARLVEGNKWGDQFWGMCRGYGLNRLGGILMQIRAELREGKTDDNETD